MASDPDSSPTRAQLAEHLRTHPDATPIEAVAQTGADPGRWLDVVERALEADDPVDWLLNRSDAPGGEPDAGTAGARGTAPKEDPSPTGEEDDGDYHVTVDSGTIADHYERVRPVYEKLANVEDYPTMGLDDLAGWYITKDEHDVEALEEGYDKRRRPASFARDLDTVLGRVDRSIYGLTTYKSPSAFSRWRSARLDAGNEYEYRSGETPTPLVEDLRAVSVWGDIDLTDELKGERGDLDEDTRATAEAALEAYAEEFGTLVGGTDAVYGLDSVGGAYLFTAPEATIPIADHVREEHGERWVGVVLREVIDRSNEWLKDAQARVEERVDGAADVIDPDWANNHNRKYKAPLSIHKDHDAVVTPIDTDDVDYSLTALEDVTDEHVDDGERWAEEFTHVEHTDRVAPLVEQLFDEEDADDWREQIDAFVADREAAEERREALEQHREQQAERDLDLTEHDITPSIHDVQEAVDRLDIERVAGDTIVDVWTGRRSDLTDRSGSGKKSIVPCWANGYNSGNATYIDLEKGIFNDTDSGDHGTAVEMALIAREGWPVGKIADGEDWARGVQHLRELGYEIPVWTPDAEATPDAEKMPYWALRRAAVALGVVQEDELVERDSDTGDVVDEDHDDDTYLAFPAGKYGDAIRAVEDAGLVTGRTPPTSDADDDAEEDESPRELLSLDVVVEPGDALAAARAVEPDDLDTPLPEFEHDDVDDVAVAVALAEGMIDSADEFPTDGDYTDAYYIARDQYGAPLPKYLDNSTLEEREDLVFAALERVGPEHIIDHCRSDVTVENPSGQAIAKLDPTWEESQSGERILAGYGSGFWCAAHGVSFSPIQLVALEHGLISSETVYPRGEAFKEAYRLLREEYRAPVPKWRATMIEQVAVLPPSVRVIDDNPDTISLDEARQNTEALIRDAVGVHDRAQLVTVVPGGGKTYSTAVVADDTPVLYVAKRNELKEQMEDYAAEVSERDDIAASPSAYHLPILAENQLPDEAIEAGISAIRDRGTQLLQKREELFEIISPHLTDDEDGDTGLGGDAGAGDDDDVDLDRRTCPTAEGEHGEEWRAAVQIARAQGFEPSIIHRRDTALFGEELPCQQHSDCEYTRAWDDVRDRDDCPDILIGSPGHAYIDSATTYFDYDHDGNRVESPRAVVIDEFPEDTFANNYGERFMDHAVWLSECLTGIDTREDLLAAELNNDTWVDVWLDGDGDELGATADVLELLDAASSLADASTAAEDLLDGQLLKQARGQTSANLRKTRETLETLANGDPEDLLDLRARCETLEETAERAESDANRAYANDARGDAGTLYELSSTLEEDVLEPLRFAAGAVDEGEDLAELLEERARELPIGGDLKALVDDAVDAITGDAPDQLLDAAISALKGGRDGCRELAVYGRDGYSHPNSWALLAAAIANSEDQGVSEVSLDTFSFDDSEGGRFKKTSRNGAQLYGDMNHHGAIVNDTPGFTDLGGRKCPVLGLDATANPTLWKIAIGRDAQIRDIHDTMEERRRFIRETLSHRVVQTANTPLPYHGDPDGKNFQEDLEVVRATAEEYTGTGPDSLDEKGPAVISTLKVLNYLNDGIEEHSGEAVNYENMKGSDALGDHQVAVILGCQHYGDQEPEKWALYAGEDAGRGDTSGDTLNYGSDAANAYLRHMQEDHTMQAILRAGRNDDASIVVAHTSALREDVPVVDQGAVVSAHSKGTLAVAEAAAELRGQTFSAHNIANELRGDIGLRQVQNVLADLRESDYLRVEEQGGPGVAFEYEHQEDPGLADVDLPKTPDVVESNPEPGYEKSANSTQYSWNFVSRDSETGGTGVLPESRPTIPAADTASAVSGGPPPS